MKTLVRAAVLAVAAVLGGCAGDIFPGSIKGPDNSGLTLPGPGGAQSRFNASGTYYQGEITTGGSDWIYIDLDAQKQVTPADPTASSDWDIAYRGVEIKLNGGASGAPPGGNAVIVYGDKSAEGTPYGFDAIDGAPPPNAAPYVTDERKGLLPALPIEIPLDPTARTELAMLNYPAADQDPDAATGSGDHGWYRAGGLTGSEISVRGNVGYILRSVECRYFKMRMTSYDGMLLRFDVQQITGPSCATAEGGVAPLGRASFAAGSAGSTIVKTNASDDTDWVYLDLQGQQQVTPANPADDGSWDIAVRRSDFKLNGGVSGSGSVEIHDLLRDDWDARNAAPAGTEYHTDAGGALAMQTYPASETASSAACGGVNGDFGWYYYSGFCNDGGGIHRITPRDVVYLLRDRTRKLWKLRVLNYYDEAGSSAHPSLEYTAISGF